MGIKKDRLMNQIDYQSNNLCKIGIVSSKDGGCQIVLDDKYSGFRHLLNDTAQDKLQKQKTKPTNLKGPLWAFKDVVIQDIENTDPDYKISARIAHFVSRE